MIITCADLQEWLELNRGKVLCTMIYSSTSYAGLLSGDKCMPNEAEAGQGASNRRSWEMGVWSEDAVAKPGCIVYSIGSDGLTGQSYT